MTTDMNNELIITLKNENSEIERLNGLIIRLADEHRLSEKEKYDLILILEEFLTNIIKYGYQDSKEHIIIVRISLDAGEIRASIEDDGVAFNPLDSPDPDINESLEERRIGGLGIFLIRKLTKKLDYERKDGRNIISFIKNIS